MRMKTTKIFSIVLVAASFCMLSCTKSFVDRNTNPEQATDQMLDYDGLRVGSRFLNMSANVIPTYQNGDSEYGTDRYQVIQGLAGDIFSGYEGASNGGFSQNNVYNINPDGWAKAMFEDAYVRCIGPWMKLNQLRIDNPTENADELALADILKVAVMQRVTDTYGPIPYTQLTTGSLQVAYDSQEEVYKAMFKDLGNAIDVLTATLTANPGLHLMSRYDRIFAGDVTKWLKFANTLRLRMAMRVVYADKALYQEQADAAIANPFGFITEDVKFTPAKGAAWENPIYVIEYVYNDGDAKVGATITTIMNGFEDPRRAKYFVAGSDGEYHGVRMGANVNSEYPKSTLLSKTKISNDDPMKWMSGAECFFLKAEYNLRKGDDAQAKADYEAGIAQSFQLTGAGDASAYIALTDKTPGTYTDPVTAGNSYNTDLSEVSVAWESQTEFEAHLEQIITQKYIAGFPEGQEAWSEFRRTGYPHVIPTLRNNSNGTINTDKQIRRLVYPASEYSANGANVAAGVALLGGADNGGTRLWWDQNPRF